MVLLSELCKEETSCGSMTITLKVHRATIHTDIDSVVTVLRMCFLNSLSEGAKIFSLREKSGLDIVFFVRRSTSSLSAIFDATLVFLQWQSGKPTGFTC